MFRVGLVLIFFGGLAVIIRWARRRTLRRNRASALATNAWRQTFERLKTDARFLPLKQELERSQPTSFASSTTINGWQLVHLALLSDCGEHLVFDDMAQAKFIVAYLSNRFDKKQVAMDLATQQFYEQKLGAFAFRTVVPGWGKTAAIE